MWPPPWSRRKYIVFGFPAVGAALLGGLGWLLGPPWAVAGILVGLVAGVWALLFMFTRGKPDPELLLRSGRPQEAYRQLQYEISFAREQVGKRPVLREVFANRLETLANTGRHGEALAAIDPALQIYRRLTVKDRNAYLPSLAAALTSQADALGHLDRITEARAAIAEAELISTDMLPSTQPSTQS